MKIIHILADDTKTDDLSEIIIRENIKDFYAEVEKIIKETKNQ